MVLGQANHTASGSIPFFLTESSLF